MATKIITAATALLLGLSTVAFAGNPKTNARTDAKTDAKTTVNTENNGQDEDDAVVKWFHFSGNALSQTDLSNPSKYSPELAPTCSSTTETYRCDIKILSMAGDQNKPDLTQPIQDHRERATPNP